VWITSFSVGGAIGPLLGGVLLEWFWRGSVFLLAVPVMALLLVLGPLLLPEFRDPRAGRLDLAGWAGQRPAGRCRTRVEPPPDVATSRTDRVVDQGRAGRP
jgi:MFS family permease